MASRRALNNILSQLKSILSSPENNLITTPQTPPYSR